MNEEVQSQSLQTLIQRKAVQVFTPLEGFIRRQAVASILLLLAIIIAIFIHNSLWFEAFNALSAEHIGLYLGPRDINITLQHLISDGLLSLFFFMVGLEIKRELLTGQLRRHKQALFVLTTAIGGMIVPALIYLAINYNSSGSSGWAIPMATDTAFAIGVMALLARRVSIGASIFLTSVAIIDDIITILIIALFYTKEFNSYFLLIALLPFSILMVCNLLGARKGWVYFIFGLILWFYIYQSGIHATLAGILVALTVPAHPRIGQIDFIEKMKRQLLAFEKGRKAHESILRSEGQHQLAENMNSTVKSASTPLQSWHALFETPIAIFILPLFAVFNAGILISSYNFEAALFSSVSWGIIIGLVIGKPLGITLFGFIAMRTKLGKLPYGMSFNEVLSVGLFSGIGFTMSLFIASLCFENSEYLEQAKIGILLSSILAAIFGSICIFYNSSKHRTASDAILKKAN